MHFHRNFLRRRLRGTVPDPVTWKRPSANVVAATQQAAETMFPPKPEKIALETSATFHNS